MKQQNNILDQILKLLISYKDGEDKIIDIKILKNIVAKEEKNNNNIGTNDERLDPDFYGMSVDDECPAIEWFAFILFYILCNNKINEKNLLLALKTINYHGLFGLIDLFIDNNNVECSESDSFYFFYYQHIAKYYKNFGDVEETRKYNSKTIKYAKEMDILPYYFALQSKFNSDYLLRKGMAKEYSKLSYLHAINSTSFKDKYEINYIICLDTFAKDIYFENPRKAEEIYQEINCLSKKYSKNNDRIFFRQLELRIKHLIKKKEYMKIPTLVHEYDQNIYLRLTNRPKAKYIRLLHFLRLFRKISEITTIDDIWFSNKYTSYLNGEAEFILNDICIQNAKSFHDRRFIALGYLEYSFWLVKVKKIDEAIDQLKKGLEIFDNNNKSIINSIYIEIVREIANLYLRKHEWEQSIFYYHKLYRYFEFITTELDEQKKQLENSFDDTDCLNEFSYLSFDERNSMYNSLLFDYNTLVNSLLEYDSYIINTQSFALNQVKELIGRLNYLIKHDIRKIYNNLSEVKNGFLDLKKSIYGDSISNQIARFELEIKSLDSYIKEYDKIELNSINSEINLSKVIDSCIETSFNHYENVIITNSSHNNIYAKFDANLLKEFIINLANNAYFSGTNNNIEKIEIDFKIFRNGSLIYMECTDNCGSTKSLKKKIQDLNNGIYFNDIKSKESGIALILLKRCVNNNLKWKVKSTDNKSKKLIIPLIEGE